MEFDKRALYGKLGDLALASTMPLGWAYVGTLAVASALNIHDRDGHVRSNIYTGLIAPVGTSKTAVAEAIEKSIFLPSLTVSTTTPGSDRGLIKMLGTDGNTTLLIEDEFRAVLDKCAIPNSTLPKVLCKLWGKNRAGVSDKKGVDECDGKLCILGNIPAEDTVADLTGWPETTWSGMLHFRDIVNSKSLYRKYSTIIGRVRAMMLDEDILMRVRTLERDNTGKAMRGKVTPFYVFPPKGLSK